MKIEVNATPITDLIHKDSNGKAKIFKARETFPGILEPFASGVMRLTVGNCTWLYDSTKTVSEQWLLVGAEKGEN